MFFVSIMVFVIMELPPGDYADRYAFKKYGTGGGSSNRVVDFKTLKWTIPFSESETLLASAHFPICVEFEISVK